MSDQTTPPRPTPSNNSAWFAGIVLILVGVFFLVRTFTGFDLDNWWALFILIPAFGSFSRAYSIYQTEGHMNSAARSAAIGGLIFTLIAVAFLFGLNFGYIWPLFLILGGLALLLNAFWKD
jgi:hypothetical protein